MGFVCFGEDAGAENLVLFRVEWLQAAMKGYLLCAAGAAGVVLVPPLCSATSGCSCVRILCVSCICGCKSHWNGCMIVVMLCCHVRREMQVSHVMLQNA